MEIDTDIKIQRLKAKHAWQHDDVLLNSKTLEFKQLPEVNVIQVEPYQMARRKKK